jgi:hypothetical protein
MIHEKNSSLEGELLKGKITISTHVQQQGATTSRIVMQPESNNPNDFYKLHAGIHKDIRIFTTSFFQLPSRVIIKHMFNHTLYFH